MDRYREGNEVEEVKREKKKKIEEMEIIEDGYRRNL